MSAYKTPGVYVEEIVKFPPSVAQVETAIPAFIGYTEKATSKVKGDLNGIPTRITSMLEYEIYFGKAKKEEGIEVVVEESKNSRGDNLRTISVGEPVSRQPFLMYYSLQMYFANGGGPCYVTSVGRYGDKALLDNDDTSVLDVKEAQLKKGLQAVRKVDEVTLLVFPDATSLSSDTDFYSLYNLALIQCNELQDRFTIIDTFSDKEEGVGEKSDIGVLRNGINLEKDYLKYGAAYYPYLQTVLDYQYDEANVSVIINKKESSTNSVLSDLESIVTEIRKRNEALKGLLDLSSLIKEIKDTTDDAQKKDLAVKRINTIIQSTSGIETYFNKFLAISKENNLNTDGVDKWVKDNLKEAQSGLNGLLTHLNKKSTKPEDVITNDIKANTLGKILIKEAKNLFVRIEEQYNTPTSDVSEIIAEFKKSVSGATKIETSLNKLKTGDTSVKQDNQLYNQIKSEINNLPVVLPPSSTMAGIYARVDSDRGVWKAPANVGLNYVIKPTVQVSHEGQRDLNIDTIAGKSVNAIRAFVGKGNLVWGARTLAGNDNEWRYISVRRFFNMVEESVKKATEQYVFEPNDKNTWVRVKAMIDNYLTLQWRAGALVGPTPDKAFYVSIGLGETMTSQDVLEGNMIIEIGMAVVRPAEFIILKFSHKMQEA